MSEPIKIVILLEGGMIADVLSAGVAVAYALVDYDRDDTAKRDLFMVPQHNADPVEAHGHIAVADRNFPAHALAMFAAVEAHQGREDDDAEESDCGQCEGTGRTQSASNLEDEPCPVCDGYGTIDGTIVPDACASPIGETAQPVSARSTPSAKMAAPVAPLELSAGVTFSEANLETGMCLWEAMLEIRDRADIAARFEDVGTVAMRHAVMTLIADCEREWEAARNLDEDHSPYDWEWCPSFLERNRSRLGINQHEEECPANDGFGCRCGER